MKAHIFEHLPIDR